MALFRRDSESGNGATHAASQQPSGEQATTTRIAPGTISEGSLESTEMVEILGVFKGTIRGGSTVQIGRRGVVEGDVTAQRVSVAGKIVGSVVGSERVTIESTGRVEGEVSGGGLVIEEGGVLEGRSRPVLGEGKGS